MKAVSSLALTMSAIGLLALAVSAQQPTLPPAAAGSYSWNSDATPHAFAFRFDTQNQAAELAKQYLKAESDADKREIRQKLTKVLDEMFDKHMKQQQDELEKLEKQIADLRAVMKKRANAKSTIVDRRIEQLIQDADGLGWNASGGNHSFMIPQPFDTFRQDSAARTRPAKKADDVKKSNKADKDE